MVDYFEAIPNNLLFDKSSVDNEIVSRRKLDKADSQSNRQSTGIRHSHC